MWKGTKVFLCTMTMCAICFTSMYFLAFFCQLPGKASSPCSAPSSAPTTCALQPLYRASKAVCR